MMPMNEEHTMDANQILDEIKKLIEKERSENETDDTDISHLEDAAASMEKFVAMEKVEPSEEKPMMKTSDNSDVVDTGVLTGPIGGLKNFLIKKSQDNKTY